MIIFLVVGFLLPIYQSTVTFKKIIVIQIIFPSNHSFISFIAKKNYILNPMMNVMCWEKKNKTTFFRCKQIFYDFFTLITTTTTTTSSFNSLIKDVLEIDSTTNKKKLDIVLFLKEKYIPILNIVVIIIIMMTIIIGTNCYLFWIICGSGNGR